MVGGSDADVEYRISDRSVGACYVECAVAVVDSVYDGCGGVSPYSVDGGVGAGTG